MDLEGKLDLIDVLAFNQRKIVPLELQTDHDIVFADLELVSRRSRKVFAPKPSNLMTTELFDSMIFLA